MSRQMNMGLWSVKCAEKRGCHYLPSLHADLVKGVAMRLAAGLRENVSPAAHHLLHCSGRARICGQSLALPLKESSAGTRSRAHWPQRAAKHLHLRGESGDRATRATIGFKLGEAGVGNFQRPASLVHGECYRDSFDRNDLADQLRQFGHRSAMLACVDLENGRLLLVGSAVIDINCGAKPTLQHIARNVKSRCNGAAAHIYSIDGPLVEMPSLHGFAGAIVWFFS